ncbi:MAG TPA: twin-arginine translocase subunit TatC [Vicinamibacterales bacterium]|nr:twin-arginine translocase subunit TatC [Vicinamibacterales bacterium]
MTEPAHGNPAFDGAMGVEEEETDASGEPSRMSFLDHLDELRRRIIYSLYALVAACAVMFFFWERMFVFLAQYFQQQGGQLIYNRPMGAFMFSLYICLLSGLLVASPFIFTQVWLFVAPGLYAKEKRMVVPFVFFSTILFASGAAFAHFVAFPAMWKFFASYQGLGGIQFLQNIDDTFSFYIWMVIGLGLVFQIPLLVYFLSRFGIVSARFLLKHFRYAILGIFILAAVITPSPDAMTQIVFAAPMLGLYIVSIFVAWIFGRRKPAEV